MPSQSEKKKWFVILAAINASLGFAHYGYVFTLFNSIQGLLKFYIFPGATTSEYSLIASVPNIGGALGAIMTGLLSKHLGRRKTMILSDCISIFGVILTLIPHFATLIIGRTLTGFTAGVASVIVPIYITEIAREPLRGPLGCIPVIAQSTGMLIGFLIGLTVPMFVVRRIPDIGYRIMLGVPAVMNISRIVNLTLFFEFETPFYLVQTNQDEQAKATLNLLYDSDNNEQFQSIIYERDYMFEQDDITIRDLIKPKYRPVFLMGLLLAFGQQFVGGNTIPTFSNMIFAEGTGQSLDGSIPLILTLVLGVLNVLFSVLVLILIKHHGRRFFIVNMMLLLIVIDVILASLSYIDTIGSWPAKMFVLSWIAAYSLSIGTIMFLYLAETLPDIGVGITILANWIGGFLVNQLFLIGVERVNYYGVFLFYAVMSIFVFLLAAFYMTESKGKSKLEILKVSKGSEQEQETLIERPESLLDY